MSRREENKWVEKIKSMSDEEILEQEKNLLLKYGLISSLGFIVAILGFILFIISIKG